jgi:methyl-accepting chemotaxis protein
MERTSSSGQGGSHVAVLHEHIQRVEDFSDAKADQFYADSVSLSRELFMQLGLLVTVTLLSSLVIILVLFRNIRKPLRELTVATQEYLKGNHDARCGYDAADEFGQFADSFNELAGTVQSELELGGTLRVTGSRDAQCGRRQTFLP